MRNSSAEVVVAGHICLDVIPAISEPQGKMDALLVPGKLTAIGPAVTATGGAVANTGLALHKLGVSSCLMGKTGNDLFGRAILDSLHSYDPALTEGMIVENGENTSYSLVISPPGVDRVFLHCTGANDTFHSDDLNYDQVAKARHFHFGYPPLMRRMYIDAGEEIVKVFSRVKKEGLTTSLDLAKPDPDSESGKVNWKGLLTQLLPNVDVFLPSFEEILFMLDRDLYERLLMEYGADKLLKAVNGQLLAELSDTLLKMGPAVVAFKLGEYGLYVRTTKKTDRLKSMGRCAPKQMHLWLNKECLAPCFNVEVAGTTGAGDCTIAGFLAGMMNGLPLEEVMTGAVAVGACNVEQTDAVSGIVSWSAVQERITKGWERRKVNLRLSGWKWDKEKSIWRGPNDFGHSAC